jgi:hypothetical protein
MNLFGLKPLHVTIVIVVTSKDQKASDPFFNFDQKLRITKDF